MNPLLSLLAITAFLSFAVSLKGQHDSTETHQDELGSVLALFQKGTVHGHVRNYFMATINQGSLRDYYSNAVGGSIAYHSAEYRGFSLEVKGIFTYNTGDNRLNVKDEQVGKSAVWEKELYDVNRPGEVKDLDRLENLLLMYRNKGLKITAGKIDINYSPLLLNRDGRMKPFVYRGIWATQSLKKSTLYLGIIDGVSPRGMTEWFSLKEAIGINNNGLTYNGENADYHHKSDTKGMVVAGLESQLNQTISVKIWQYALHKINHTTWLQSDFKRGSYFGGLQLVKQFTDASQKDLVAEQRYAQADDNALVIASKLGKKVGRKGFQVSVAYLNVLSGGRFLFPKEMGRENFYVAQPRSWVDGFGKTKIYQAGLAFLPKSKRLKSMDFSCFVNYIDAPEQNDFKHNKYNRSSFFQSTLWFNYHFQRYLSGLHFTALYIARLSAESNRAPEDIFYKTNLHHINLIVNLNF